jgi:integrase
MTNPESPKAAKPAKSNGKIHLVRSGSVTLKIYELTRRQGDYFTVAWHVGPKRYRQNFKTLDEARRFAKGKSEALAAGQVNAPNVTVAQAQDMKEAVRRIGPLGMPVHVVAGEYADVVKQLGDTGTLRQAVEFYLHNSIRPDMQRTVAQVMEEFVASKRANGCSQVYIDDCTWRLRRFVRDFQVPISHICTKDIEEWLGKLSTSLVTRNDFRRLIITLFNFARRRGYLPRDRETEARWLEKPRLKSKPIQIFMPQELGELLAVAEGQPKLAIALGAFTGIRSAELLRLRWENFNWEEQVVDLGCDQTKTASRRLVPILEPLRAWIAPFVNREGSVLGYSLPVCLAEAFATTAKKADKARKERDPDAPDLKWKANGLRHSFASYRLAMIEDVAKVSLEMGNSPQKKRRRERRSVRHSPTRRVSRSNMESRPRRRVRHSRQRLTAHPGNAVRSSFPNLARCRNHYRTDSCGFSTCASVPASSFPSPRRPRTTRPTSFRSVALRCPLPSGASGSNPRAGSSDAFPRSWGCSFA